MIYQLPSIAIARAKEKLYNLGQVVEQQHWQSIKSPDKTLELLNHSTGFIIPDYIGVLVNEVKPTLPWADDHFQERVSGRPLNPPPSHVNWPFSKDDNKTFTKQGKFSHTYPERFWPKEAWDKEDRPVNGINRGIRFNYGDLYDLIELLNSDPSTRQAYLPIWFPEDLFAARLKERVPCTLGYHLIIRNNYLHITYFIRSCDIIRHFRNDIYMACRLVYYIIEKLPKWELKPGQFLMHITSLHCFYNERALLNIPKT